MNITLLGHMGRDDALAERLEGHKLDVIGQWHNPGLLAKAEASGGLLHVVNSIVDMESVSSIVRVTKPDMFITNSDDALAAGVVDLVQQEIPGVLSPCPDQAAFAIESDKFFLRELVDEIDPNFNPESFMVTDRTALEGACDYFSRRHRPVVIKPRNLTGGKGVKIMGKHFSEFSEGLDYGKEVLGSHDQTGLEVQELITGPEFNLQILTDGRLIVRPPVTVDYPYRFDDDTGPGTGGLGVFSVPEGQEPAIITDQDYQDAIGLVEKILDKLNQYDLDFRGWLYPGFMKTATGLKIIEMNARGGDPEMINIMDLLPPEVDFAQVMVDVARGELVPSQVTYQKQASAMIYLVTKGYGRSAGAESIKYGFDPVRARQMGCNVRFGATEQVGLNSYRTVGNSRAIGLSALAETPWDAREIIHDAIGSCFDDPLHLEFRKDVADRKYIEKMIRLSSES